MKNFATLAAFAAGGNALVSRADSCCFHLTASGAASGTVGQLGDGQNRLGGGLAAASFCIDSNGAITDSSGRGCVVTSSVTQFQCDLGTTAQTGFSISSGGQLEYQGDSTFVACQTGDNGELNIYTTESSSVTGCSSITLAADSCSGSGTGAGGGGGTATAVSSVQVPGQTGKPGSVLPGQSSASVPGGAASGTGVPGGVSPGQSSASIPGGPISSAPVPSAGCASAQTVTVTTTVIQSNCAAGSSGVPVPIPTPGTSVPGVPQSTQPAGTQPAGTQPAGTQPAGTQPAGTAPGGTQPAGTAPGGTQPAGTQPAGTQPAGTAPGGTQPAGTQPASTRPGQPGVTQPAGTQPIPVPIPIPGTSVPGVPHSTQPAGTQPAGTQPGGTQPAGTPPAGTAPSGTQPAGTKPVGTTPGGTQPAGTQPAGTQPGGTQPAGTTPGGTQPAGTTPGGTQPAGTTPAGTTPGGTQPAGTKPTGTQPASTQSAPSGTSGGASSTQPSASATRSGAASCPTDLSGDYEYPHLIVPVNSSTPDTAYGSQLFGTVSSTVSTIFNFDIPSSDSGKTCSLIFLFPNKEDLETSDYTFSGDGKVDFSQLTSAAGLKTTYNSAPSVKQDYGEITISPGNSYLVASFSCPAGQTVGYEMKGTGNTYLNFFEDYNPSPLGLFITVC
ncbi:hypothetical protein BO99DRAFT_19552 [Aspergillus violaceofuscus CBS 115571]|uniref:Uncharacterized protein n=1 Tax=Aspergillus violaceofuscus (strain CBS 115571) TaxID=1450538 RepID=A0A2V5HD87_ASPV1|nr:hypothetical protein BO99DRAFT_19552 [Aspergillus violaceofuscus CBS 115571]